MPILTKGITFSFSGHAETKSHTRHPHTGSAQHHRSIRADIRTNLSFESTSSSSSLASIGGPSTSGTNPEYTQIYSKQNAKLMLECAVNINFSNSIWLKDGQIVQTILKDNTNNKRVIGHRFLVDSSGNLFIDNVRLEDDGRWQCEAEDAFGFVVTGRPIQLTILGKCPNFFHSNTLCVCSFSFLKFISFIKLYVQSLLSL